MQNQVNLKTMRDVLIERLYHEMRKNKNIFFLSADFGSPLLDLIRKRFKDRFINIGIAEQNLINISAGLALEGFTVYAYAIAPFLTMRAYEQIRINLSLLAQLKEINVNLIGVGAGFSYDVSGPTHHCLEDLIIIKTLPNFIVFSPSDWVLTRNFVDLSIKVKKPKYIRLDSKPLPQIYNENIRLNLGSGFRELMQGDKVCLVSTGYMTHIALKTAKNLSKEKIKIGVIDVFLLKPLAGQRLYKLLKKYKTIFTLEEAFKNKGGLDTVISNILLDNKSGAVLKRLGVPDRYIFESGSRSYLHTLSNLDERSIVSSIKKQS